MSAVNGLGRWKLSCEKRKTYGSDGEGVKHAEAFEICEYGRRPSKEEIKKLFPFLP